MLKEMEIGLGEWLIRQNVISFESQKTYKKLRTLIYMWVPSLEGRRKGDIYVFLVSQHISIGMV